MCGLYNQFLSMHAVTHNAYRKTHRGAKPQCSFYSICITMSLEFKLRAGSSSLCKSQKLDISGWSLLRMFQQKNLSVEAEARQSLGRGCRPWELPLGFTVINSFSASSGKFLFQRKGKQESSGYWEFRKYCITYVHMCVYVFYVTCFSTFKALRNFLVILLTCRF